MNTQQPNWQPLRMLPTIANHIREGLDTGASFIVTLIGPGERWMAEKETQLPEGLNDRQKQAMEYLREQGEINTKR